MSTQAPEPNSVVIMPHHWSFGRHIPVIVTLFGIGLIYAVIAEHFGFAKRWLILELIIPLAIVVMYTVQSGRFRMSRTFGLALLGVITIAEALSVSYLVVSLIDASQRSAPHDAAIVLLRDASLLWIVNILTFALWYWELDAGGPGHRHRAGYHSTDFVFPQFTIDAEAAGRWCPQFIDYLFLSFNTSTAFSPTDTLVLSHRAKLLLMLQALISLAVLAIIAARAINTL
jgi:hypothetical protein